MAIILNRPVKIVIADDHEVVREGFQSMMTGHAAVTLAGVAANGRELLKLVSTQEPDVVITDIRMPVMDGIAATRELIASRPATGVIAFTMYGEEPLIVDMLEAGARGFLLKSASKLEVLEAIRTVCHGRTYYCSDTSQQMTRILASSNLMRRRQTVKPAFSERELSIIRLICAGLSNKEIAARLEVSVRTIEGHRERIQEKMESHNTAGIVVYAIREGIYQL